MCLISKPWTSSAFQFAGVPRRRDPSSLSEIRIAGYSEVALYSAKDDHNEPQSEPYRKRKSKVMTITPEVPVDDSLETYADLTKPSDVIEEDDNVLQFRSTAFYLSEAALIGTLTGFSVALFKLSIEGLREACYQQPFLMNDVVRASVPAAGGLIVGLLYLAGRRDFPPGLRQTIQQVDSIALESVVLSFKEKVEIQLDFLRKSSAAVFTLGTGASLGPEGPCVELGMNVARGCMDIKPELLKSQRSNWNMVLLNCGAAAGVAAGFNAPLAGVFFTLEVMQSALVSTRQERGYAVDNSFLSAAENLTPVLLSSVLSALVSRTILGDALVLSLKDYSLQTPLVELPLYLVLGVISGFVAFTFSKTANFVQAVFAGKEGPDELQDLMRSIPDATKPMLGGLICGSIALVFPQVLFFGYETLNSLLANDSLPVSLLLSLLVVKTIATAISVGSGLVGGTFAPSLFLGAVTGASFHNVVETILTDLQTTLNLPVQAIADVPAYAMVGAASVLAALFRAPLTATLLLFEVTRDYEVILPLMVSAGLGGLAADILVEKDKRRRDQDSASWGDLAAKEDRKTKES